jgi:hypothetical protein
MLVSGLYGFIPKDDSTQAPKSAKKVSSSAISMDYALKRSYPTSKKNAANCYGVEDFYISSTETY